MSKKSVEGKNKDQLAEENLKLKEKLRELMSVAKRQDSEDQVNSSELTDEAMGIYRDKESGAYKLVNVAYNRASGQAKVRETKDASRLPKDAMMALYEAKIQLSKLMAKAEKE